MNDDLSIFQNQEEVAENLKKSAQGLGLDIDESTIEKLADGTPQEVYVAKGNCNWCYGRGTVDFVKNKITANHNRAEADKDGAWKKDNMVKALCKCVKVRLV